MKPTICNIATQVQAGSEVGTIDSMHQDVTAERFVELLFRSGLIPVEQVETVLAEVGYSPEQRRISARSLAERLVVRGTLTQFQASKLLRGRYLGLVMGPYKLLTPLGSGGMGRVYLAQDQRRVTQARVPYIGATSESEYPWESLIALKVLPPRLAVEEPRMIQRFEREERYYRRVSHPHLVRLEEAGQWQGVRYLALEFVPGRSLQNLVAHWGRLDPDRAIRLFADIAAGLQHLHEQKLIHRDIKPANIMVTAQGTGKILDLGLAMAVDEPPPLDIRIAGGQGYIVGTMDYIAPEQARHATAVDHRADLYSLGCTLYFALTGTPPFPGGSKKDKIRWQRWAEPLPIQQLNPTIPPPLARLVEWLMAKRPEHRPESAQVVHNELLNLAHAERSKLIIPVLSAQETINLYDTEATVTDWWTEASSDTVTVGDVVRGASIGEDQTLFPSRSLFPSAPAPLSMFTLRELLVIALLLIGIFALFVGLLWCCHSP